MWSTGEAQGRPLSVLVLARDGAGHGALLTGLDSAADPLRSTRAHTLPAALEALSTDAFDVVIADLGVSEAEVVDVARALRTGAGDAALVVAVDVPADAPAELAGLTDLVLGPHDLDRDWRPALRRALEQARVRAALQSAQASVARLRGIVESVGDAVFTTDPDDVVTSWNSGAELLYGYSEAEMVGANASVLHPHGSDEHRRVREMVLDGQVVRGLETVVRTRGGRLAEVALDVAPLRGLSGEPAGLVVVGRDITDRRELEAELVRRTMHDALTGLPNKAFLSYRLTQSLAVARRHDSPVAVLVIDLDEFKAFDEVHGHLAGDRVLVEVANRVSALARPTDLVARLGGDEFVLVCPDTGVDDASRMADRLLDAVAAPIPGGSPARTGQRVHRVRASVGIAVSPPLSADAETLLGHAGIAVDEAKARGRSRSQVYDHEFAREAAVRRRLAGDLEESLALGLVEVRYQPVVDLGTDRLVGLEALARWQHPVFGAVPPSTFVPLAEAHGFVATLDRWVLDRACHETAGAIRAAAIPSTVRVAVNLSARSLGDPGLVAAVDDVLRRSELPPGLLVLEVTETALLQDRDTARATLASLRALGVGIHLDDFGTGYSSLSFLRELPVTGVKIDRSFVTGAADRPEDLAIVEAVVRLAAGLGLETVAEGVETAEHRDLLRDLGCASAQGFWWGAAVPIVDVDGRPGWTRSAVGATDLGPAGRGWSSRGRVGART